jgi:putative tryptophan/tyrosine transport system substrate-binding protein
MGFGEAMRRRKFIKLIGGVAAAWPLVARAQQPTMPVIGFLNSSSPEGYAPRVADFREGSKEAGYVDGRNVTVEFRWAEGRYERLPEMATDLVRRQVSVIVANTPANVVAKAATSTIPIVFTTSSDPVKLGLVSSLNRPGGNVTGVTQLDVELGPKRLELAHEIMPVATRVALLVNSAYPSTDTIVKDMQAAALSRGLQLHILRASTETEIEAAFAGFAELKAGVLIMGTDPFFSGQIGRLAILALRYAVPMIYQTREFTAAGGLVSYGGSIKDSYRLAGVYAGRILKGDKPADLPVQQSTSVELIVNLKTAKALGVSIPLSLLGRADELIEQ